MFEDLLSHKISWSYAVVAQMTGVGSNPEICTAIMLVLFMIGN
jgi:hypothetical protein